MMGVLHKFLSHKIIYILAFVLYAQGAICESNRVYSPIHDTIDRFEAEQKMDELLLLIQKRLVIMHEVARTKWTQNLPIEDKRREHQILVDLVAKANQYDLNEKLIIQFFQAQIDASKEIQKRDFLIWKENKVSKFEKIFSLKDEIRFYIDRLNHEMLDLLGEIYTNSFEFSDNDVLNHPISKRSSDYIEDDIWLLAVSPLKINQ